MRIRKVQLQRLSVCDCGFPLLNVAIGLGTGYEIDLDSVRQNGWHLTCGGCHKTMRDIPTVMASQTLRPEMPPARLPYSVFVGSSLAPVAEPEETAGRLQ